MSTKKPTATPKPKAKPEPRADGLQPKYGQLLDLLKNPKGTTIAGIQEAFGIQPHSARAMLSILRTKHAIVIEVDKQPGGATYRVGR